MDLINELKDIKNNKLPIENLIQNLEEEYANLGIKIYLLKIINISKLVNQLAQTEMSNDQISGIELSHNYDQSNKFSIQLFDHKEKYIKKDTQFRENSRYLLELLKQHEKLNQDYVSKSFWNNRTGKIFFNQDIQDQVFDIFLNDELKKSLKYNQLSANLEENQNNNKKLKL